jgi:hypothetical protein
VGQLWPFSTDWIGEAAKLNPRHWIVFCGYKDLGRVHVALATYVEITAVFVWRKSNAPQMTRPIPRLDCEFVIWARAKGADCGNMGQFKSLVLDVPMAYAGIGGGERIRKWHNGPAAHPCQKPLAIVQPFIERLDITTVLDPFMGSGTTGVACVQTGRDFIGIEIDPGYFAIAEKRIKEAQAQGKLEFETGNA